MSPVGVTVRAEMPLRAAWALMRRHQLRALAVVGDDGKLAGIVSKSDFFSAGILDRTGRVRSWVPGPRARRVEDIMTGKIQSALPDTPIARLVPPMVDQGLHQIPVVNAHNRVVGLVTQQNLIAGLFRNDHEPMAVEPAAR